MTRFNGLCILHPYSANPLWELTALPGPKLDYGGGTTRGERKVEGKKGMRVERRGERREGEGREVKD